jgi:hypothetical protein
MKSRTQYLDGCLRSTFGLMSALLVLLAQNAPAAQVIQTLPFYDSFDYNPATGLESASSTVWETCYNTANLETTNGSLTLAGFVPSAGNSVIGVSHGVRFAGTQFTGQTNTSVNAVYVSFLYQVTAYPTTNGIIAFLDSTNVGTSSSATATHAGLALVMNHAGHIGINSGLVATNGAQFESAVTALNTTVLIVARYTFHPAGNDSVDLWVNPSSSTYGAASAPASDETLNNTYNLSYLANFTLSYDNGDTAFGERWDEVRIGTSWAQVVPSSVTPGPVSAAHSLMTTATPTSIVASGTSTSVVAMQARDTNGVNLTTGGATVTFATTLGTLSSTTDNGNGTYQATLTSSTSVGTAKVTAKLGGTSIASIGTATNSASLAVNFTLGPVSATASTATAIPTIVAADGLTLSTITITAMDDYNHPLAGQTVSLSVSGSGNTYTTNPPATGTNGQTTATLASTVAETKTITVTIGSTQINAQPTVTFTAQGPSAVLSTAVASPNSGLVADGVSTSMITITAMSGADQPLSGQAVTLSVSGSGNNLTQPASATDVNGITTATLQSTVAGTKTITVNIAGTVINAQPTVTFVPGAATQIVFTSEPVTTAVGLTMPNVVVQIEDQYGNAVPQSGATVTLALNTGTLSGTNPEVTDATGKATFANLSIPTISSGLYLTATVAGFSPVQSTGFNAPPKTFYKLNNTTALNLAASWTSVEGGAGPAGPPATDGMGIWDTNSSGGTMDIGGSATWYGIVLGANGAVTVSDINGGSTLTLGTGSLDGSGAVHSVTMSNSIALSANQTWRWSSNSYALTLAGNLNNGGYLLTIEGLNANGKEVFNGAVTGSGGLTLISNAAVTLSGTNTYSGNTTVSAGKLVINTNGSIANTPSIALASGTTLDVSAASLFTVVGGQTLSAGTNGTATIAASTSKGPGTLILAPNAQAGFSVAGSTSSSSVTIGKLSVQGGVTLNGNAIAVNVTGMPLPAGTYTLMIATNGFTVNSSLPVPTITGQGLAGGSLPQIVINGEDLQLVVDFGVSPSGITNSCGDSATFTATTAIGATSYQWYDPSLEPIAGATNLTLELTDTHPSDSGIYTIVATGPAGDATNSVVLLNTDTAPPTFTLNGSSSMALTLGSTFVDPGVTAYDTCSGDSLPVTTTGAVNTSVAGEYDITYSAVTANGVPGTATRGVVVFDPTVALPAVTLNLDFGAATDANPQNPITVPSGWSLLAYGNLYTSPEVWGSPSFPNPDGNNPGLTLSFGNISGWSTASGQTSGANSSAVVGISTNGFFNYGSKGSGLPATFTLSGVPLGQCVSIYAVDGWGGAADAPVIVYGDQTNTVTAASFDASPSIGEFQYVGTAVATNGVVTGSWTGIGGPLTEGQIGGMIIQVQSIPLNNFVVAPSSVAPQCGSNVTFTTSASGLPPITYQWYDNNTNPIAGATNAAYTLVDPTEADLGNFTVVAQNAYNSLTNTVAVTAILHTAPPVMTLNGGTPVNLMVNSPYVDAGATAYDLCAQAWLPVSSNSTVNTSVVGSYTVTYSAITADGTPGSITRVVNISTTPDFGSNVIIFDPTMGDIQSQVYSVYSEQQYNQFGTQRYALLFKPGQYNNLDIPVGFYTQVLGLGQMPGDTTISGFVHSDGILGDGNATENFWRGTENFAMIPTMYGANYMMWAVSQGTWLRRMHIEGNLDLANFTAVNWASGGFMADSVVDDAVEPIAQQQWLSRNDVWGSWAGGVWNMVFVGVTNPPAGTWPAGFTTNDTTDVYTTITNTPLIREKPYLCLDSNGNYEVMVPALETNSQGITWANGPTPGVAIPINQFYIAQAATDTAASINAALSSGLNLILAPGVYNLTDTIQVTRPGTIVLGLGLATLIPQTGVPAMVVSDVDGVEVAGLLFDAGPVQTPTLLEVGTTTPSALNHSGAPIFLYDISMRVGGAEPGMTASCLEINANDVVGDNIWLWRADHGNGVGWTNNMCNNGLIVNGDRVTMYGLFVEHHQQYQTLWNGNWGRLYFYQSELPYDPPSQDAWSHDGVEGYASYKVADQVTSHQAYGLGIYAVFIDCTNISSFNAIETPTNSQQVNVHDAITVYIGGNTSGNGVSTLTHIINGTGATLAGPGFGGTGTMNCLWPEPTFNMGMVLSGTNASISLPTESWHSYQLQYKNALTDPAWLNLGSPFGGNDTLETVTDTNAPASRFYRVGAF